MKTAFVFARIAVAAIGMASGFTAAFAGESAKEVLQKTNLRGGIACVIGADQTDTAVGLAKVGNFIVHLLDADPTKVADAKSKLATTGLLGRAIVVDALRGGKSPYADNLLDLVVAPVGAPVAESEILRVLAPLRGKAMVGDKVVAKPALPGMGDWTHRMGNPGNNPAATDTVFRAPEMLQYLATPFETSFHGSMLNEGGLRIEFSDWTTKKPDRNLVAGKLTARSQANGTMLWQRELPQGIEPDWPTCALVQGRIYVADGEANRVMVIDGETGNDLPAIKIAGDANLRVRWLAIADGRLHALLGPPTPVRQPRMFISSKGYHDLRKEQGKAGSTLIALDLATGKEIYRHAEPGAIDYRTVALDQGRTCFYTINTRVGCLEPTGKLAWENHDPAWVGDLSKGRLMNLNYEAASTLIVAPGNELMLTVPWQGKQAMVFDKTNGKLLYTVPAGAPKSFFVEDKLYTTGKILDAASGKEFPETKPNSIGGGCGIATWVPGLKASVGHVGLYFKSPCGNPTRAAGGLLHIAPSQCDCGYMFHGAAAMAYGGEILEQAAKRPEHPLDTGVANPPSAARDPQPGDWPVFRGGVNHFGAAALPVAATAKLAWVAKPQNLLAVPAGHDWNRMEWLERPTAPITAGGMAFYATSLGEVCGVNLAGGKIACPSRVVILHRRLTARRS